MYILLLVIWCQTVQRSASTVQRGAIVWLLFLLWPKDGKVKGWIIHSGIWLLFETCSRAAAKKNNGITVKNWTVENLATGLLSGWTSFGCDYELGNVFNGQLKLPSMAKNWKQVSSKQQVMLRVVQRGSIYQSLTSPKGTLISRGVHFSSDSSIP